jgi:Ca-activated chloride channel family protein
MFRLQHPEYLWLLLLLIPLLGAYLYFVRWHARSISALGNKELIFAHFSGYSPSRLHIKAFLYILAILLLIIGIANPQLGSKMEKIKRQGIELIIALDVSNSMLSEDVQPNRLGRAKNFIQKFLDELSNDKVGFIVFAGRAYLQMPLSTDYAAARMYVRSISPSFIPTQGTAISEAVQLAQDSYEEEKNEHKALIVITDGEDNEGGAEEVIAEAAAKGIKIFTIGVGTDAGAPVPVISKGITADYKRDEAGNIVMSKLNQAALRSYAEAGKGKYFLMGSGRDEIKSILSELGRIQSKELEEEVFTDFDDQFQWFIFCSLMLVLIEFFIPNKKWFQ